MLLAKAFSTYARPLLEYNCQVFNPITVHETNLIEAVQRRFIKRIYLRCGLDRETSYIDRCKHLNIHTLEHRRAILDILLLFKILHGKTILNANNFINFADIRVRGYSKKNLKAKYVPRDLTSSCNFFFRTVSLWNNLPASVKDAPTLSIFKTLLLSLPVDAIVPESLIRL
uniref:Uncharacterized protein n=1 Tax=Acrobeloides nanus TaxID=290746 RepID=A0A914EEX6_9BILA